MTDKFCKDCRFARFGYALVGPGAVRTWSGPKCGHPSGGLSPVTGNPMTRCLDARFDKTKCGPTGVFFLPKPAKSWWPF